MNNILNITSRLNLEDAIKCFSPEEIDYFYTTSTISKRGVVVYFTSINFTKKLMPQELAHRLSSFIIQKYEDNVLNKILKNRFIELSDKDSAEILQTAKKSILLFNQVYNNMIFVKNLTNYFENSNTISLEGFFNFRTEEYQRIVEMVLTDSIEQFVIKEEYNEFVDMLKQYIDLSEPQIDLIHIKPNCDGTFLFYNFKKERIIFETNEENPIEIFLTNQDMLMSILILLMPKRIIWHDNSNLICCNIKLTLKKIFDERFSVCTGCELCDD